MSNLSLLNLSHSNFAEQNRGDQFLRFQLYPDTKAMLPIRQITEVLKIQFGQIVPIPQMPSWVMGVYNWRGDILWMLDLGHLIGLDTWYKHKLNRSNHTAIVLSPHRDSQGNNTNNVHLGLVVAQVEDFATCDKNAIQSNLGSNVSSQLNSFLQGYWLQADGEMILALNGQAIAVAMPSSPS